MLFDLRKVSELRVLDCRIYKQVGERVARDGACPLMRLLQLCESGKGGLFSDEFRVVGNLPSLTLPVRVGSVICERQRFAFYFTALPFFLCETLPRILKLRAGAHGFSIRDCFTMKPLALPSAAS